MTTSLDEWHIGEARAGDIRLYHTECKSIIGGPAGVYIKEVTFCCGSCGKVPPQEILDACLLVGVWRKFESKRFRDD